MDEEQSNQETKKSLTKKIMTGIGATATIILAPGFALAGYMYARTTELGYKTLKKAYDHPLMTTTLLAGGLWYSAHSDQVHEKVDSGLERVTRTYAEYRIGTQDSQENTATGLSPEVLFGTGLGGGALLGMGGYALYRNARKRNDIFVIRKK